MTVSLTNKIWILKKHDKDKVYELSKLNNITLMQAKLLLNRGIDKNINNFLFPKVKNLMPNPNLIKNLDLGTSVLLNSLSKNENIIIWGDYDVDGICSTTLLINYFKEIGYKNVTFHIPNRFEDGYGIKKQGIKKIQNLENYDLFVIVDCGSNDIEAIEYLKSLNKKIIIIDHHIVQTNPPEIEAFINIKQKSDTSDLEYLCATGLVFMFLVSFNNKFYASYPNTKKIQMIKFLDIVAIATICDVMPLINLNRAFIKTGLKIMNNSQNNGLLSLMKSLNITVPSVTDIGFSIGPCLNAPGRLSSPMLSVLLLTSIDENIDNLSDLSKEIVTINTQRKLIVNYVFKQAIEQAKEKKNNKFLLLYGNEWHEGIIGIVASKIKDIFDKPCCIVSFYNDIGKGSGRSTNYFDLGNALISAKNFLLHYGGHKKAVGFSIQKEKINDFDKYMQEFLSDYTSQSIINIDEEISIESVSEKLYTEINQLEPFGEANPEPVFCIKNISIKNKKIFSENHFSCKIESKNKKQKDAFIFNCIGSPIYECIMNTKEEETYDIACKLLKSQKTKKIILIIIDINVPTSTIKE